MLVSDMKARFRLLSRRT